MNSVKIAIVEASDQIDSKPRYQGWMSGRRSGSPRVSLRVALEREFETDVAAGREGCINVLECLDLLGSAI
jgi:hypothetical protein